jgi:hypothetical protein
MKTYLENSRTGAFVPTKTLSHNRPINDTFNVFIKNLSMLIGEPTSRRITNLSHDEYRGKRRAPISIIYNTYAVQFTTDEYSVTFCPSDNGVVELYKIEIKKPKCGIGTNLMNLILDVCDKMNIKCALIPVGEFRNRYGMTTPTNVLIQWYGSFGFKKNVLTQYFIYTPNF